jgi:hypothetical protein
MTKKAVKNSPVATLKILESHNWTSHHIMGQGGLNLPSSPTSGDSHSLIPLQKF